jgi:hypothetical protein
MTEDAHSEFNMLDVGFGTLPRGDVNVDFFRSGFNPQTGDQIKGGFVSPKKVKNFVVADVMHLPFKANAFKVAFSSHTIEHVKNPMLMLREMCRVAERKVIVRCPHRRGSGAVMPFHLNYLDEEWFRKASELLGFEGSQFITFYDYPISSPLKKIGSSGITATLPWRALQRLERRHLNAKVGIPFEVEAWIRKKSPANSSGVKFVVIYNNPVVFKNSFESNTYIASENLISHFSEGRESVPMLFNQMIQKHLRENTWFVFCTEGFAPEEDLQKHFQNKNTGAIYGPIGTRLPYEKYFGQVHRTGGGTIGRRLSEDAPVQTLDEVCLVAHAEVFRQGLSFDERFQRHFYGTDLCMQAYTSGFDVMATQTECRINNAHFPETIVSREYLQSLNEFREKWSMFLPLRTLTTVVT